MLLRNGGDSVVYGCQLPTCARGNGYTGTFVLRFREVNIPWPTKG